MESTAILKITFMIFSVYKTNKKVAQKKYSHLFYILYWIPNETNSKKKVFALMEFR